MKTIYLSARFGRAAELREYREQLRAMGHVVTSRWLDESQENDAITDESVMSEYAEDDIIDIRNCEVFIAFTEAPDSPHGRGGRHVEFGYVVSELGWYGLDSIYVVGPCENVFHALPCVTRFETWAEFVQHAKGWGK